MKIFTSQPNKIEYTTVKYADAREYRHVNHDVSSLNRLSKWQLSTKIKIKPAVPIFKLLLRIYTHTMNDYPLI